MERKRELRGLSLVEGLLGLAVGAVLLAVATPVLVEGRREAQTRECVANLARIRDAKAGWARKHPFSGGIAPSEAELFGPGRALPRKPVCPTGGSYSINALDEKPTCSVGPQALAFPHRH